MYLLYKQQQNNTKPTKLYFATLLQLRIIKSCDLSHSTYTRT